MAAETAVKLVNKEIASKDVTFDFCKLCATFCLQNSVKSNGLTPEYYI
jgi:hypothetical protein